MSGGILRCISGIILLAHIVKGQTEIDNLGSKDIPKNAEYAPKVFVSCQADQICVDVDRNWLKSHWGVMDINYLMLNKRCNISVETTESEVTLCTPKEQLMSCGSEFTQNDTHVTIQNGVKILFLPLSYHPTPVVRTTIPWECSYPLKVIVETKFLPLISPITIIQSNVTSSGKFEAAMFLYKDDKFQHAYTTVPNLGMADRLRVKVRLLRGPENSRLQTVECWATSKEMTEEDYQAYTLIENYCPAAHASRTGVTIYDNGYQHHVTWESRVFRFISSPQVFIHCNVRVCFHGSECNKDCSGSDSRMRQRREIEERTSGLVSLGPLEISGDVTEILEPIGQGFDAGVQYRGHPSPPEAQEAYLFGLSKTVSFVLIGAVAILCVATVILVGICIHRKTREAKTKTQIFWEQQLANRQSLTKSFTLSNGPPFEIPLSVPNTLTKTEVRSS